MTAKEKRYVRSLEIKIEQLEATLKRSQETWVEQFTAIYEDRTAMRQAYACIMDALQLLHGQIRNDPAFVHDQKLVEAEF